MRYFVAVMFGGMIAALIWLNPSKAADRNDIITIASGRAGGIYLPAAGAICKLVNDRQPETEITCTVEFGVGSVNNIIALRNDKVTLAIAQSDTHRDAVTGAGPFEKFGPFKEMRSVAALFVEQVTIVSRQDKGLTKFSDLKGKRVYLSKPGSGGRILIQKLMEAESWSLADIVEVTRHRAPNLAQALCDNEFDAFAIVVGHPSPLIREAAATCNIVLVPIASVGIHSLVQEDSLYASATVPGGMYHNNPHDIPGVGLVATLVTTYKEKPDVIYAVTKALFEGLGRLRAASPLFSSLDAARMATEGLSAPLHKGAAQYYSEAGLR